MNTRFYCLECRQPISAGVHEFSQELYGYSLCMKDQYYLEESGATAQSIDLYLALKARNFPVKLDYFDGYKRIGIAVPGKLFIEVSGHDYVTEWETICSLANTEDQKKLKVPVIIVSNGMLETKRTFSRVVNELSKACRVILQPDCGFSSYSAPPWTTVQLQ